MFNFRIRKKLETPEHQKLEQIRNLLFPPYVKRDMPSGQKILVDKSVDMNLEAALQDLKEGHNDEISHKTIDNCITPLTEVRKILEAYGEFDPEVDYIIIDISDKEKEDSIETIKIDSISEH